MKLSQDFINKVLDRVDIVDVIGEFVNLQKAGANYKALCPFHNERTPSFIVSPSKGIFKCFGCGEAGNAVSFLMKYEKISFVEAIKWLANKYNIPIEEVELSEEDKKKFAERDSLLIVNKVAKDFFEKQLWETDLGKQIAYQYFKHRGFTDETIKKFDLGYAPNQKDAFINYAKSKGYKIELLQKAGLITQRENEFFDRFRNRVIFPIHSISGNVVGFAGRILGDNKNIAKYLNTPETILYQKRELLYGLHLAKKSIVREDKCYVVEGYTDVISMHQAGIENTIASAGTSLTEDHVRIIRRFTRNVTLVFDGDQAGLKAAIRGVDIVLKEDMNVRVVVLPEDEDPDSFSKKMHPQDLKEYLETNEQDFIHFKINLFLDDVKNDPIEKAKLLTSIAKTISVIPDQIKRDVYIRQSAQLLEVDEKALYSQVNKFLIQQKKALFYKQKTKENIRETPIIPDEITSLSIPEEKALLFYLLKFGHKPFDKIITEDEARQRSVAEYIITELQNEKLEFVNLFYKKLFEKYEQALMTGKQIDEKYFLNLPEQDLQKTVLEVLEDDVHLEQYRGKDKPDLEKDYKEKVRKAIILFKTSILTKEIEKLQKLLLQTTDENEYLQIVAQIQELIKLRNMLNQQGTKRVVW